MVTCLYNLSCIDKLSSRKHPPPAPPRELEKLRTPPYGGREADAGSGAKVPAKKWCTPREAGKTIACDGCASLIGGALVFGVGG